MKKPVFATLTMISLLAACGGGGGGGSSAPSPAVSLDTTFAGDGVQIYTAAQSWGRATAIDPLGRIVVAGAGLDPITNAQGMLVWRTLPDGSLDPDFHGTGSFFWDPSGNWSAEGHAIELDSAGRIVVAATAQDTLLKQAVVWRLKPDGTPDPLFGPDGKGWIVLPNLHGEEFSTSARGLAIDSADRIIVCGSCVTSLGDQNLAVWRIAESGEMDSGFGDTGCRTVEDPDLAHRNNHGNDVAVDEFGFLKIAGETESANGVDMMVWALTPDGSDDLTFGAGWVRYDSADPATSYESATAVRLLPNQRTVVAGWSWDFMMVWIYDWNGTLLFSYRSDIENSVGEALTLDGEGRILVAGDTMSGLVLWRFGADLAPDFVVAHEKTGAGDWGDEVRGVAVDPQGRIVLAGYGYDSANMNFMAIWRFH